MRYTTPLTVLLAGCLLAGVLAVAGAAMGGEAAEKPDPVADRIEFLAKRIAGSEANLATIQPKVDAALRAGKSPGSHAKMADMMRTMIANDKAEMAALQREQAKAKANPAAAALIRYKQAREAVAVCEVALAAAKTEVAAAAAEVKAAGGTIPDEEPR